MISILLLGWYSGYRVNATASEPLGLWRIEALNRPVNVGDVVFICPPMNAIMTQAFDRGYLRRGLCKGGVAPLIKTVFGIPGQRIEIGRSIAVDGRAVASSAIVDADGQGRPLRPYRGGTVPPESVFLFSPFPGSFDSRFFGPLPTTGILGLAREVLTFAP